MAENIVLIGMPGAGKSVLGKALQAALPHKTFLDTDTLIEEHMGMTLQQIIDAHGHRYLRRIEADIITQLTLNNHIVATGGSAVYSRQAMQHLQHHSTIIYLTAPSDILLKRIAATPNRGIAKPAHQTWPELLKERTALYKKYANITIDTDTHTLEACCKRIIQKLTPTD